MKERKTDRPCKEGKKKKEIDMRIRRGMEGGRRRGEERVGGEGEKGRGEGSGSGDREDGRGEKEREEGEEGEEKGKVRKRGG